MKYKRCEKCKAITKVEPNEETECVYCGSKEGFTQATEKGWRKYLVDIVMQPFEDKNIKPSTQATFSRETAQQQERDWSKSNEGQNR